MNKNILGTVIAALASMSAPAWAGHDHDGRHDNGRGPDRGYARVIGAEPIFEQVRYTVPVESCWVEAREVGYRRASSTGAAIVGGAVGALIGNSIGHGDGRAVATVGGAVVGAVVGREVARNSNPRPVYEEVQRCRTVHEERIDRQVAGYRVTYVWSGRRSVVHLPQDPGRYVRVDHRGRPFGGRAFA